MSATRFVSGLLLFCLALPSVRLHAASGAMTRQQVQAAYLYRFLEFVEWPQSAAAGTARYSVCVVGDESLARELRAFVNGKAISGRPVAIRQLADVKEAHDCHVLFLTGRRGSVAAQLAAIGSDPVLTVSDVPEFIDDGGMIAFAFDGDRMQFSIANDNAKKRGILISSRLLQLSRSTR